LCCFATFTTEKREKEKGKRKREKRILNKKAKKILPDPTASKTEVNRFHLALTIQDPG
jgi:uncharacterized protein (DUF2225 family)